ncbi:hypothetical protein [Phragmitibacter flavus]|uniref:hypothetical protein n=1 Tax=Phragmitibacter flavus TaxID=2576071 RepID=UPI0010FE562E|nr:hypothetical protein [Phragmitibacter flavus]
MLFCLIAGTLPNVAYAANSYFQGDYAATFVFKPTHAKKNQRNTGLLVMTVKPDGEVSASYLTKGTDINFHVKGKIDKDGNFEGRVFYEGKDWGAHKGSFTKSDNGTIKGELHETPNGRGTPHGHLKISGGPIIGRKR